MRDELYELLMVIYHDHNAVARWLKSRGSMGPREREAEARAIGAWIDTHVSPRLAV